MRLVHPAVFPSKLGQEGLGVADEALRVVRKVVARRYKCCRWREVVEDWNSGSAPREYLLILI
jgi:hypothetical protein